MKKLHFIVIFLFSVFAQTFAQTAGSLTVSTATSTAGGGYAPKNIVAIWVADENGNFVKTLLAYAANRKSHLNTWQAATLAAGSEFNVVDAITGATQSNHNTRSCSWNGLDFTGQAVPDGTYYVWMELTDKNSTGNFSSFAFTKGTENHSQTPANVPSFASISINWIPTNITNIGESIEDKVVVTPNPSNGKFTVSGNNIEEVEVWNCLGQLICRTTETSFDLSNERSGVYYCIVKKNNNITAIQLVKN